MFNGILQEIRDGSFAVVDWVFSPYHCVFLLIMHKLFVLKVICKTGARHIVGVCSNVYLECVHGIWRQKRCPAMTIFDVTISQCSYNAAGCEPQQAAIQHPSAQTTSRFVVAQAERPMAAIFAQPKVTPPPPCEIGELIPRGECLATFLECVEFNKFLLRHCAEVRNFLLLMPDFHLRLLGWASTIQYWSSWLFSRFPL